MGLSVALEDTLKAIYYLEEESEAPVGTSAIAERLDRTPATVTSALDKLEERDLIERVPYEGSRLTDGGRTVALELLRHHRLLETYLAEHLDYSWDEVHEEAEILEHHISERFETRLAAALDEPHVDPHGDPIPGADLDPPTDDGTVSLTACEPGDRVVIARVSDRDEEDLAYLADVGITPGTVVEILEVAPFGMVTLAVGDTSQSLPETVADSIRVRAASQTTDPTAVSSGGGA